MCVCDGVALVATVGREGDQGDYRGGGCGVWRGGGVSGCGAERHIFLLPTHCKQS